MKLEVNPRVAAMRPSATLAVTQKAAQLRREGKAVISLSAGEPDFPTPKFIVDAVVDAMQHGAGFNYTDNAGMPELRQALADKFKRENGIDYSPQEIICSNGGKQSVAQAMIVVCRPNDEVLIPAPCWVSYPEMAILAGATPVALPTTVENHYRVTPADLEAAITPNTRLFIMCSPSNPTGSVYSREELEALAEVLRRHPHVYILSDELYEHVIFDAEHVSFASLEGMRDRTITINGLSKAYAMTGWRLGYMAAPLDIVKAADKVQGQLTSNACHLSQIAGIAAMKMGLEPLEEMVQAFRARRDFMLDGFSKIEGIVCPKPEGAFYLFPNVSAYFGYQTPDGNVIENSNDMCLYLLESCLVAAVPGEAFGDPNGLRISYATSMQNLEKALAQITEGLAALKPAAVLS
jgi:aspartate/methionine/tyrosine aminotransferase